MHLGPICTVPEAPVIDLQRQLPILSPSAQGQLLPALRQVIDYRKSGLSLNHVIGRPIDCGYCVRHLFQNFEMKIPRALISDDEAVELLVKHQYFEAHATPVQIFNRATDPMLAIVKPHTFRVLRNLDDRGLTNHVLVITRWHIREEDCVYFNSLKNIRLTLLVTHSGITDDRIEPVDSGIAVASLKTAFANAKSYRVIQYWRPIVPGLNDSDNDIAKARELAEHAHATVYTGLFFKNQISAYYQDHGLPLPYEGTATRKIFPEQLEQRILQAFRQPDGTFGSLFRKTSCGVTYAHSVADYNGHYGIREVCDICPLSQVNLCKKAWVKPDQGRAERLAQGLGGQLVEINDRAVVVSGISDSMRNMMQHRLGYQVHDVAKPHLYRQHGRANIGWPQTLADTAGV